MASADFVMGMMAEAHIPASQMTPQNCWKFFINCSDSQIQRLVDSDELYVVTQGPDDLLYLPAGMFFVERSLCDSDVFGFLSRGAVASSLDSGCASRLESIQKGMNDAGANTSSIDKVLGFLKTSTSSGA